MTAKIAQITVDDDFARFGAKSYAINKINTVEMRERAPHGMTGMFICGLLTIIFLFTYLGSLSGNTKSSFGTLLVALVCGGLTYYQWRRSKIREYSLFLRTSSSEVQAYISSDQDEVQSLRDRIERAMVRQSRIGAA